MKPTKSKGKTGKSKKTPAYQDRIDNPQNYGYVDNKNGSISTHRMGTAEVDGSFVAFPNIVQDPATGKLREFGDDKWKQALQWNMKNGNVKKFATESEALTYSKNYKTPEFGKYYADNKDVQALKQKYKPTKKKP